MASLDQAIRADIIPAKGPIAECCGKYGIDRILLRNGRVVGPSAGLAQVLERLLRDLPTGQFVFDQFEGTGLTRAVCAKMAGKVRVEANDRLGPNSTSTGYDAFQCLPAQSVDILVVDPLYEDVMAYLHRAKTSTKFRYAIVQCGNKSDVLWNKATKELLRTIGTLKTEYMDIDTYGSEIYVISTMDREDDGGTSEKSDQSARAAIQQEAAGNRGRRLGKKPVHH